MKYRKLGKQHKNTSKWKGMKEEPTIRLASRGLYRCMRPYTLALNWWTAPEERKMQQLLIRIQLALPFVSSQGKLWPFTVVLSDRQPLCNFLAFTLMAMSSQYFTSSKFLTFETFFRIKPLTELQEAQVHIMQKLLALSCQVDISAGGTRVSVVYESFTHSKFIQDNYSLCLFKYFNPSFLQNKLIFANHFSISCISAKKLYSLYKLSPLFQVAKLC